ncbi:tRNA(m(1)G37)methyltransferase [Apophysomyces ossiformis]|uniref:tRNA(M(1)G37)methyltransferase n=1 Tax=Apophysomyces ossiformis TaxID=679940 RepID=A0A8H7EPC2_9FUNG|nr:tRNA(m(1)G37)methyltransferase [Apophysomyces ossiformis]
MVDFSPIRRPGMTTLDRDVFKQKFKTLALRVPSKKISSFIHLKELLNQPPLHNIISDPESSQTKLVLLRLDLCEEDIAQLPGESRDKIEEAVAVVTHTFEVTYDDWSIDQILRAVMPEESVEIPSSYTQIGHIAHLNLKEEYLPYKHLIGQVILDKNKKITSVVNKTHAIDNTFRNFQMEVLAGNSDTVAQLAENGCRFRFDFARVYWNSRLQSEHERLVKQFHRAESICE